MNGIAAKMPFIPVLNLSWKFDLRLPNQQNDPQSSIRAFANLLVTNLGNHGVIDTSSLSQSASSWFKINHCQVQQDEDATQRIRAELTNFIEELRSEQKSVHDPSILVILPKDGEHLYPLVKRIGDCELGIYNICSRRTQIDKQKNLGNFCGNLALKYQVKGHAETHAVKELKHVSLEDCLIIGADVTHPGRGAVNGCPSIAAVFGSIGPNHMTYPGELRLQASRQEVSHCPFRHCAC